MRLSDLSKEISFYNEDIKNEKTQDPENFDSIITQNKIMLSLFTYSEAISQSNQPVLITGESGTVKGKSPKQSTSVVQEQANWYQ